MRSSWSSSGVKGKNLFLLKVRFDLILKNSLKIIRYFSNNINGLPTSVLHFVLKTGTTLADFKSSGIIVKQMTQSYL